MSGDMNQPVSTKREIENLDALIEFEKKLFAFEDAIKDSIEPAQMKAYESCLSLRRYVLEAVQKDEVHQSKYFSSFLSIIYTMLKNIQQHLKHETKAQQAEKELPADIVAEKSSSILQDENLDLNGLYADFLEKYKLCQRLKIYTTIFDEFNKKFEGLKSSVEDYVQKHKQHPDLVEARKFFVEKSNQLKSAIAQCVLIGRFQTIRKPGVHRPTGVRHQ